jgi:hypothetical protein
MQDLIDGILPVEASRITAKEAWEVVVFDQFKERLRDHWKQVADAYLLFVICRTSSGSSPS